MTTFFDSQALQNVLEFIVIVGGVAYVIGQSWNGRRTNSSAQLTDANATIDLLQKSIDTLEKKIKDIESTNERLLHDIETFKEEIRRKDAIIAQYQTLFQGSDSTLGTFINQQTVLTTELTSEIKTLVATMKDGMKNQELMMALIKAAAK